MPFPLAPPNQTTVEWVRQGWNKNSDILKPKIFIVINQATHFSHFSDRWMDLPDKKNEIWSSLQVLNADELWKLSHKKKNKWWHTWLKRVLIPYEFNDDTKWLQQYSLRVASSKSQTSFSRLQLPQHIS